MQMKVDPKGQWQLYAPVLPENCTSCGVIECDRVFGALVKFNATGMFAVVNARAVRKLDRFQVCHAIREWIAGSMCNNMPDNVDGIVDDHTTIALALMDGKSWEEMRQMKALNDWPETYVWLRKEMEVLS